MGKKDTKLAVQLHAVHEGKIEKKRKALSERKASHSRFSLHSR